MSSKQNHWHIFDRFFGRRRLARFNPAVSARYLAVAGLSLAILGPASAAHAQSTWHAPVVISEGDTDWYYPRVAVEGDYVHVVWRDGGASLLKYRRSTDRGMTWDAIQTLHTGVVMFPVVAVSGQYVHVVWRGHSGEVGTILYRRSTDNGANFEASQTVGTGSTRGFLPDVAAYGSNVYLAWIRNGAEGAGYDILFRRNTNNGASGSWGSTLNLTNNGSGVEEGSVRVAAYNQRVYVTWYEDTTTNCYVKFLRSNNDSGATWSGTILTLWSGALGDFGYHPIAGYGANVYVDRDNNGASGPAQRISTNSGSSFAASMWIGNGNDRGPEVDVSSAYSSNGCSVYMRSSNLYVSTGPGTETQIGTASGSSPRCDIGTTGNGDMHVVCNYREPPYRIYHYRYGPPAPEGPGDPQPPPYPHNRAMNRYISFGPNKAENDGMNVAYKVELKSLGLGSCNITGEPCRIDKMRCEGVDPVVLCQTDADCVGLGGTDRCIAPDCGACSVSGNPCLIDLYCEPTETCDDTGEICVNDQAGSVGTTWWVGPPKGYCEWTGIACSYGGTPCGTCQAHPTWGCMVDADCDGDICIPSGEECIVTHLMVSETFREVSDDWPPVVHASDCEIVPRAVYGVRAYDVDTSYESDELVVNTIARPIGSGSYWADGVGQKTDLCTGNWAACPNGNSDCPAGEICLEQWGLPDGYVNVDDISAAVFAFERAAGLTLPRTMCVDMHGSGVGNAVVDPPNYLINVSDIQQIVLAFAGWPYLYSDPGNCPDVGTWPGR